MGATRSFADPRWAKRVGAAGIVGRSARPLGEANPSAALALWAKGVADFALVAGHIHGVPPALLESAWVRPQRRSTEPKAYRGKFRTSSRPLSQTYEGGVKSVRKVRIFLGIFRDFRP